MEVNFTIDEQTYVIPQEISLHTFERAVVWNIEELKNLKPFMATVLDCPIHVLNQLDEDVFLFISGVCIHKIDVSDVKVVNQIKEWKLRKFEDFTFGEWVDLDTFMSKSATQNVTKIASILYSADEEICKDWDIKKVWGAVVEANKWRQLVYKEYDEFFELGESEGDEDAGDANIQLMWYQAVLALAGEDFLKIHQVVERPYREALNYLTWKKAQVAKQKLEILKQKNDLSRRRK
jgi:hypothetical protein